MADYTPVRANPSDVDDELKNGGPAFGTFVGSVGCAVADAQKKLDATLVETATALAKQEIEVISIWEQTINDDGQMTAGNPIKQKLPLVTYIMPTAYQWTKVFLRADMYVAKFNAANGFNIKATYATRAEAGAGGLVGLLGGRASASSSGEFGVDQTASVSVNAAAGWMHMEATLEPRPDIKPPQPFIVQKGPRMKLTAGPREEIKTNDKVTGRKLTLTLELFKVDGAVLAGKLISLQVSDPLITYTVTPADGKTDNNGTLKIELKREGGAFDETKPAEPVTVKAWLGLVVQDVTVAL